jgi:hypothetical protein
MATVEAYAESNGLRVYTTTVLERKRDLRVMSVHKILRVRATMELHKGDTATWAVSVAVVEASVAKQGYLIPF